MVTKPFSSTFMRIPFKIGIVVLEVTAFETILRALTRVLCEHENLIFDPP
jgi:hypothetical protein